LLALAAPVAGQDAEGQDLTRLSIEELSQVTVTSVSRRPQSLADAPASIHVITSDQIRRAGAASLPDVLRLAPNLQMARVDAREHAITARGFQSTIANKLLVLVDGRTVYSPLFSGVFWDAQDVIPEDIERIEIISGPGAATWGTNAVHGVINITTKRAEQTQGWLASAAFGNFERSASLRYGDTLGANGHFRAHARGLEIEDTQIPSGASAFDDWERGQIGFRADWLAGSQSFTAEAEGYTGSSGNRLFGGPVEFAGAHALARWSREDENGAGFQWLGYYERIDRDDDRLLQEEADIFDLSFQQTLPARRHTRKWGAGWRQAEDLSRPGQLFAFIPERRSLEWLHAFAQNQITLRTNLELTLGIRLERNDYTDWEFLPTARLAWGRRDAHTVWGAVSRAVRSPARLDREIFTPTSPPFIVGGGPGFDSEIAHVIELGYRAQPSSRVSFSATVFHQMYERLRSAEIAPPGSNTFVFIGNGIEGDISGVEAWGNLQANDRWRVSWGGLVLDKDLRLSRGSTDPVGPSNLGNDADYQAMLRSSHDLSADLDLDLSVRHVAELPLPEVPAYTAVDLRLGWAASDEVTVSLRLQNLFDEAHGEFGAAATRSEFERTAYLRVIWSER
jgi:iron complex outermembrane recepter protein